MTTPPKDHVDALMAMPDPEKLRTAAHYLDFPFMAQSIKEQHEAAAFLRQCADYLEASARALAAVPAAEPVGEVVDMKYNSVRFYRKPNDPAAPYLQPGTKIYTTPIAQQAGGVPAGWQVVPVEPTPKMLAALWAYKANTLAEQYAAMLAAAPSVHVWRRNEPHT